MSVKDFFNVSQEVVIITGSAGQLGLEYTKTFIDLGAKVVGIDLKIDKLTQELIKNHSQNFLFLNCDITNSTNLSSALEKIIEKFGFPTVLINNAAIDSPPNSSSSENGAFEEFSESVWDKVMEVNVKSVFLTCKIFGAAMKKNGRGSIINISSIYGILSPDQSIYEYKRKAGEVFYKPIAYSVSKSALINLTKYLAVYWAKDNIRVNTLVISGVLNNQDNEFIEAYCKRIPIGKMAASDEYNGALVFLASSSSKYMTGSNLVIDGGWTSI